MRLIKIFIYIALSITGIAFAETLEIKKDGNYISSQKIQLSEDSDVIYNITGIIELKDSAKDSNSYVIIGLAPYDLNGDALQAVNDFPMPFAENQDGYITLDILEISQNGKYQVSRKIKLGGEVKKVSFVIGASLADGAKIFVSDFQMTPEDKNVSTNSNTNSTGSSSSSPTSISTNTSNNNATSPLIYLKKDNTKPENTEKATPNSFVSRRIIFVNSELGSDKLSGLKRFRGQADGPKKTIKSALNTVLDGDHIVLQGSNAPYELASEIKSKSGQILVIRAEGKVIIKAKK